MEQASAIRRPCAGDLTRATGVVAPLALLAVITMVPFAALAAPPTPPRLSVVEGEVSFLRPDTEGWVPARLNLPLAAGDLLYTGPGAKLELQVGARAFVRADANTELGLVRIEPDLLQLQAAVGRVSLDLRELSPGDTVEIDTPNAAFTVEQPGYYRVEVGQRTSSFIVRRGGQGMVTPAGGASIHLASGERMDVEGIDTQRIATSAAPALDDWDGWNDGRTDRLLTAVSARYVPEGVYGTDALDQHGRWRTVPTYGRVWVPTRVPATWVPYSTGEWLWDPYYGWSWVDDAPWGWAPYHYGRWVHLDRTWAWAPGPVMYAPVYAPALVAFFGGHGVHGGVRVPFISWLALGWGEPVVPWWGPPGFIGAPCWLGWGGPRLVNDIVVHRHVADTHRIKHRNKRARHAVVSVPRDRFHRGRVRRSQWQSDAGDLEPLRGPLPVKKKRHSLDADQRQVRRPPAAVQARRAAAERTARRRGPQWRAADRRTQSSAYTSVRTEPPARRQQAARTQARTASGRHETAERQRRPADRVEPRNSPPDSGHSLVGAPPRQADTGRGQLRGARRRAPSRLERLRGFAGRGQGITRQGLVSEAPAPAEQSGRRHRLPLSRGRYLRRR